MFIINAGHRIIRKRNKEPPSNTILRLNAYQYPIHLYEKGDSDKTNGLPRSSRSPKSQRVLSKCTICGTHFALNDSALDERFWRKSARYLELKEAGLSCTWCDILRTLVERCTGHSVEVLASAGYVDWGGDPFYPVWYGSDEVVELEIFCTTGESADTFIILAPPPLTIVKSLNDLFGYPPYPSKRELSQIPRAMSLYERL